MSRPTPSVSLADLSSAGIRLRPYEAATLVHELALQVVRGDVPGVPSPHVIRLSLPGVISVEGPVAADGDTASRAAQLLEALLHSAPGAAPAFRVPGGLKLILARALENIDLPPYASLEAFAVALSRFAAPDAQQMVVELVMRWMEATGSQASAAHLLPPHVESFAPARGEVEIGESQGTALTISDIRRARRATGMPLHLVADRSQIPVRLLRQLEWGYLFNWPVGRDGQVHLLRYARAAGLDDELVLSTVAPLVRQAEATRLPVPAAPHANTSDRAALVPARQLELGPPAAVDAAPASNGRARTARLSLAAAAVAALVLVPAAWDRLFDRSAAPESPLARSVHLSGGAAGPAALAPDLERAPDLAAAPRLRSRASEWPDDPPARRAAGAGQAPTLRAPSHVDAPAYRLAADGVAYSPSFGVSEGAMFYHGDTDGATPLLRGDVDHRGVVLRIMRIVDDEAKNFHVRPSPDGSRIAFDSDRDGERGVYLADADGTNVRRVSPQGFAALPSWSPDGRRLAFVRAEADRPDVWNLWILELETGDLQQVTRHHYGQPWGGSWFPDGRRIAYSHVDRLVVHDLQTGKERVFPSPRKGRRMRTPAVSPDGERIMFQLDRDGAWMLEMASGKMRRVLEDPTAEEYTWSPDGRQVAFHSRRTGQWSVWVMAPR